MQTALNPTPAPASPFAATGASESQSLASGSPLSHYQIIRRNGAVVPFAPDKIAVAMMKAFLAVHGTQGAASASVREVVDSLTSVRVPRFALQTLVETSRDANEPDVVVPRAQQLEHLKELSQALLAAGARVLAVDVDEGRLQQQFGELSNRARHRVVDVSDDLAVQAAVAEATDAWGALHIAVNCAGILGPSKTLSKGQTFPPKLWNRVIGINLTGTFNVVRHAALAMTANQPNAEGERGVIVNTASGAAWQGQMGQAAYSASKAGVIGLTLPAARDLAAHGIRVMAIAPGLFETGMSAGMPTKVSQHLIDQTILFPTRMGRPDEFAGLVRHIVENAYLNATTISIDAGTRVGTR